MNIVNIMNIAQRMVYTQPAGFLEILLGFSGGVRAAELAILLRPGLSPSRCGLTVSSNDTLY